jgi:Alternative complex III, ActD subunit
MSESVSGPEGLYGLMAEFEEAGELLGAAGRVYREGYRNIDAFSPVPIHGLAEAMGQDDRTLSKIVLGGGITGCLGGYSLAYWTSAIDYPLNIGGRPLHSWPAFVIPTFETTILFAALSAVVGMLALNKLPMPYHPVFNVKRFREHASSDGLFLCIEATDPKFDRIATRRLLESLGAKEINEVEA